MALYRRVFDTEVGKNFRVIDLRSDTLVIKVNLNKKKTCNVKKNVTVSSNGGDEKSHV